MLPERHRHLDSLRLIARKTVTFNDAVADSREAVAAISWHGGLWREYLVMGTLASELI